MGATKPKSRGMVVSVLEFRLLTITLKISCTAEMA